MSLFKKIRKGIKKIGGAVVDVVQGVGDVVEDALDNDLVKAAALAAGAYFAYPAVAGAIGGAGATAGAGAASGSLLSKAGAFVSSSWTGLVDKAFLAGFQPNALGVLGYGAKQAAVGIGKEFVTRKATGMLAGGGGGQGGGSGGPALPSMARAGSTGEPSTQYGTFKANVTNLGMDPRIADAMAKVSQTNIPSIRGAMNQVGRVSASGPNISLGSSSIGVRETTRAV